MTPTTMPRSERDEHPVTMDALETLVLWPSEVGQVAVTREVTDPWPVFVLVVDEELKAGTSVVEPLVELLDHPRTAVDTMTSSHCKWSVVHPRRSLLRLEAWVRKPLDLALEIAVPAQCFLGLSDIVSAGATIAVTTRRHARRLMARVDDRTALDDVLLLGARTSGELGVLAGLLCRNAEDAEPA